MQTNNKTSLSFWHSRIMSAISSKEWRNFLDMGRKISDRYRGKTKNNFNGNNYHGYNLLFRNVKTRLPYLLPYIPKVMVDRANKDSDPVGRCASIILERLINKIAGEGELIHKLNMVKLDAELFGMATLWIKYSPEFTTDHLQSDNSVEDNYEIFEPQLKSEKIEFDYVSPTDIAFTPAKNWEEVEWVARRVHLDKDDFKKSFPNATPPLSSQSSLFDSAQDKIDVWEIWDKPTKKIYFASTQPTETDDKVLEIKDYPVDVPFPCPKPLMFDTFTDSVIPLSRHAQVWGQYLEIDELTKTISGIIPTIKVRGAYDKSLGDFAKLFSENNTNALIGIDNADKYVEKGGLNGAIFFYDTTVAVNVLNNLISVREQLIEDVRSSLGIMSIIEGQTNANEAYGTNRLKGAFGTARMQDDQSRVVYFVEELLQLSSVFITGCFEGENMIKISGIEYSDEDPNLFAPAIQLIKNYALSDIRLEIAVEETRSYVDENYKAEMFELWTTVFNNLNTAMSVCNFDPSLIHVAKTAIMAQLHTARIGRTYEAGIEAALNKVVAAVTERANTPEPQPEPPQIDPTKQMEATMQQQTELQKENIRHDIAIKKMEQTSQMNMMKNVIEEAKLALKRREQDIEENLKLNALQSGVALTGGGTNIGT